MNSKTSDAEISDDSKPSNDEPGPDDSDGLHSATDSDRSSNNSDQKSDKSFGWCSASTDSDLTDSDPSIDSSDDSPAKSSTDAVTNAGYYPAPLDMNEQESIDYAKATEKFVKQKKLSTSQVTGGDERGRGL